MAVAVYEDDRELVEIYDVEAAERIVRLDIPDQLGLDFDPSGRWLTGRVANGRVWVLDLAAVVDGCDRRGGARVRPGHVGRREPGGHRRLRDPGHVRERRRARSPLGLHVRAPCASSSGPTGSTAGPSATGGSSSVRTPATSSTPTPPASSAATSWTPTSWSSWPRAG